jgi:hypothetical protein
MALALVVAPAAGAVEGSGGAGLWEPTHTPDPTECGIGSRDANGFCTINDNGSVALGVKFTTSKNVDAVGIRIYRVDAGAVSGTLWTAAGTALATGTFSSFTPNGWQDLKFTNPVPISPGQTYVASYFAPNADYAYEYEFFTASALTVGPITALKSMDAGGNGVFVYADSFPSATYRDLNYWVTPLWAYRFAGFFQPVDNAIWNQAKAGSAIPVKFSLGGDQGLNIFKAGYPKAIPMACDSSATADTVEETVTAGGSGLTYDAAADQYTYVWKSNKSWANKCYMFDLGLNDNSIHTFAVRFFK